MIVGSAVVASMKFDPLSTSGRRALVIYRLGYANFEVPEFADNSNAIRAEHNVPKFGRENGWGNQFEIHVPVLVGAYVSAVGRFLNGSDPNPWSFQIGVSVDLEKGGKGIGDILNGAAQFLGAVKAE